MTIFRFRRITDLPALGGTYEVVGCLEAPGLFTAAPVDAPLNIRYCVVLALVDELTRLKVCANEAFVSVYGLDPFARTDLASS